jgi:hypothetical protein
MRAARRLAQLLLAALLVGARSATAQDEAQPAPSPPRWAVGFNPLAMVIGRYGGDLQRLVAPGHALIVSAHVDYASHDWQAMDYDRRSPMWGLGGEAGWRWYPSSHGTHGMRCP